MDAQNYAEVDFLTPMILLGVAAILLVFGIPLLIHGLYRRRKFKKLSTGYQTWKARSSVRTQFIVGFGGIGCAVVLGLLAWNGYGTARENFAENIEKRYQPADFELGYWNGSWATIEITLEDGTDFSDSIVVMRDGYEPFIEDVWYYTQGPEAR